MNTTLVDHLVCPRCGPPNGLLLLAHEVRDRRVLEGEFGCPNCRDRFPVAGGFGDLRPPPRGEPPAGVGVKGGGAGREGVAGGRTGIADEVAVDGRADEEDSAAVARDDHGGDAAARALRLAAALGVTQGPGMIVVPGSCGGVAGHIARLVRGIEVLVVGWGGRGVAADGVSAFVTGPRLPLRDGAVRGVVADGEGGEGWWDEGRRVLMPGRRIVITRATDKARDWVRGAGLGVVLDEQGMLAGVVPLPREGSRVGWRGGRQPKRRRPGGRPDP